MTHPIRQRPSVLLVGLPKESATALGSDEVAARLEAAGFVVIRTNSRAAAIVYGSEIAPDLVLTDPQTARVLSGCYPDGPYWVRASTVALDRVLLHGPQSSPELLDRALDALAVSHAA